MHDLVYILNKNGDAYEIYARTHKGVDTMRALGNVTEIPQHTAYEQHISKATREYNCFVAVH